MVSQYADWVWNAFKAINATCRTDSGFAAVSNVNATGGGSKYDNQESFLYAEVMKYSYLTFAEGMSISYSQKIFILIASRCSMAGQDRRQQHLCLQHRSSPAARLAHLISRFLQIPKAYAYQYIECPELGRILSIRSMDIFSLGPPLWDYSIFIRGRHEAGMISTPLLGFRSRVLPPSSCGVHAPGVYAVAVWPAFYMAECLTQSLASFQMAGDYWNALPCP